MLKIVCYRILGTTRLDFDWFPGQDVINRPRPGPIPLVRGVHDELVCDSPVALADAIENVLYLPHSLRVVGEYGGLLDMLD